MCGRAKPGCRDLELVMTDRREIWWLIDALEDAEIDAQTWAYYAKGKLTQVKY